MPSKKKINNSLRRRRRRTSDDASSSSSSAIRRIDTATVSTRTRSDAVIRASSSSSSSSDDNLPFAASSSSSSSPIAPPQRQAPPPPVRGRTGLTFSRFQGFGRLTNWFYNRKEEQLIASQKRVADSLKEFKAIFRDNPEFAVARIPREIADIERRLQVISDTDINNRDLDGVQRRLDNLRVELDRVSTKQAILLGFDDGFAKGSPQTLPAKQDMVLEMRQMALNSSFKDINRHRYLVDALAQWTSDAVLRIPARASLEPMFTYKARIAQAAALMNQSYFTGLVKRDYDKAKRDYDRACLIMQTIDFSVIAGPDDVRPKAREDWNTPFDPGSMMLAAAVNDSGIPPDLVVGLPTGGAHAANKVAGALGVLKDKLPPVWYTRPQAVKESSRALFEGIDDSQKFRREEYDYIRNILRGQLNRRESPVIMIVDDGAVSGRTLELARQIYLESFREEFPRLTVVTATVKGGSAVEDANMPVRDADERPIPNTIDFVVNQSADRVGNPGILRRTEPSHLDAKTYGALVDPSNAKVSLSTPVDIVTRTGVRSITLGQTLIDPG